MGSLFAISPCFALLTTSAGFVFLGAFGEVVSSVDLKLLMGEGDVKDFKYEFEMKQNSCNFKEALARELCMYISCRNTRIVVLTIAFKQ